MWPLCARFEHLKSVRPQCAKLGHLKSVRPQFMRLGRPESVRPQRARSEHVKSARPQCATSKSSVATATASNVYSVTTATELRVVRYHGNDMSLRLPLPQQRKRKNSIAPGSCVGSVVRVARCSSPSFYDHNTTPIRQCRQPETASPCGGAFCAGLCMSSTLLQL